MGQAISRPSGATGSSCFSSDAALLNDWIRSELKGEHSEFELEEVPIQRLADFLREVGDSS